jgi:tRNA pseudouridine65 synthase
VKEQTGKWVYPVHRLDRATSGVLLFALSSEVASLMSLKFQAQEMRKTYYCVVRGWVTEPGWVDHPLDGRESVTEFAPLARLELPHAVGRYPSARYSLVEVNLLTGRTHQIRRHFAHLSHPLIGDTVYGDGKHNQFFRDVLGVKALLLKAYSLEFQHGDRSLRVVSRWSQPWHTLFDLFGACPAPRH